MLELLIAFLFSIGWLTPENIDALEMHQVDESTYGVVITDGTQQKGTFLYDKEQETFIYY